MYVILFPWLQFFRADNVEQCDIVEDLVAIVPGIEGSVTRVVVQHGDMWVLILKGNVNVLIRRGVGGVGVIDLGASWVAIGDVERATDHKRLASTPFGVVGGPALDDLQRVGVQLADNNIAGVLIGGVDSPQASLVHHQVNIGMAAPGVVICVIEASVVELPGLANGRGAEVELDNDVALEFVEVDGAVVDHLTSSWPRVGQPVGREVVWRHKVLHRPVLPHKAVVVVTIHVPDLHDHDQKEKEELGSNIAELTGKKPCSSSFAIAPRVWEYTDHTQNKSNHTVNKHPNYVSAETSSGADEAEIWQLLNTNSHDDNRGVAWARPCRDDAHHSR